MFLKQSPSALKKVAIVGLILIPILISFMEFETTRRIFNHIPWGTKTLSISPTMVSTLAAVASYLSMIVRFRMKVFSNVYETLMAMLNILLCASFLSVFFGETSWSIFTIDSRPFLMIAIIFSWVGMRSIAGFVWILLFLLSLTRLFQVEEAMGLWGVVYVITAFIGIMLQVGNSVFKLTEVKEEFMGAGQQIGGDLNASKEVACHTALNVASPAMAAGVNIAKSISKK